jgi:uncharacterized membrane protein
VNERLREALRRKIAAHNRLVRLSTVASAIAVVFMWGAIYFVARWLVIFSSTVVKGIDATMPRRFERHFAMILGVWLMLGWVARKFRYFEKLRSEQTAGHVLVELLLAPPRATFAVVQNISNRIAFSEDDLIVATDFLAKVGRAGKIRLTAATFDLPDEKQRGRVTTALQLLDLIYLRRKEDEAWYAVSNPQKLLAFLTPLPGTAA